MKSLVIFLLLLSGFLWSQETPKNIDTIVITAHKPSEDSPGVSFEERYEYRDSTPYGLIGLQDTFRVLEKKGKIYFLPGIWAPIPEIGQKKNMPVATNVPSINKDMEVKEENAPSISESSPNKESSDKMERDVEKGISVVFLALGVLYPFLSSIPKIPLLGIAFMLSSFLAPAQEVVRYRVKAVKANGKDTSVSNISALYNLPRDCTLVWIPKVFTPNGDNLNDDFLPVLHNCPFFIIDLYTREGEYLITLNKNQKWPGKGTTNSYIWLADWRDTKGRLHHKSGIVYEIHSEKP